MLTIPLTFLIRCRVETAVIDTAINEFIFEDLLKKLLTEFEIDEKNARRDLLFFLNDLMGRNIVYSR